MQIHNYSLNAVEDIVTAAIVAIAICAITVASIIVSFLSIYDDVGNLNELFGG